MKFMYINNKKLNGIKKFAVKRIMPLAMSFIFLGSFSGCRDKVVSDVENEVGYENILPIFNRKVNSNNFVLLNIGDSKNDGVSFLDSKIKYCNDNDISLGIVVTPTSLDINDIYDDVELVKGIVDMYDIDFPVYLNIDNIISNNDIDNTLKSKIIDIFMDKCSSNGIYVCFYGKDTNLVYMKKYCDISGFDACVVMDNDEIRYDGVCNVVVDLDGNVSSKVDFSSVIINKDLNNSNRFLSDGVYVFKDNDDIMDIAMKYDLSVNALLEYNNINLEDVVAGTELMIPSSVGVNISSVKYNILENLTDVSRGCDISHYQTNIDWNAIKNNFNYVILKCSEGTTVDSRFSDNAANCSLNDISYGVYCFNACRGNGYSDLETFRNAVSEQSNKCIEIIANKNVDYPVFLDLEVVSEDVSNVFTPEQIKIILDDWKDTISSNGYIPGLYCNKSIYEYICKNYDVSDFEIWIAGYGNQYNKKCSLNDLKVPDSLDYEYNGVSYKVDMVQTCQYVVDAGAGDKNGYLDVNYTFKDYTSYEGKASYKNIVRDIIPFYGKVAMIGGASMFALSGIVIISNKVKKARIKNRYNGRLRKKI